MAHTSGQDSIRLGRLVDNVLSIPEQDLTARRLQSVVSQTKLDLDFLNEKLRICPKIYTRNLIVRNPLLEVILVNWGRGQVSPVHDHGESFGAVLVCKGELGCTQYRVEPVDEQRYSVVETTSHVTLEGDVGMTEKGEIHKQGNFSTNGDVVSLHFYIRSLNALHRFELDSGERFESDLHYCLGEAQCEYVVEGGTGECTRE